MKAYDVMTKHVHCCTPETPLVSVARMMADFDCGAIPVVGDLGARFPLGMITDRDTVVRAIARGRNPLELTVRDCMTTPALTLTKDADLDDVVELLEEQQVRRVIIVDARGACCGIIAQADIANHASRRIAGHLLRDVSRPPPEPEPDAVRPE